MNVWARAADENVSTCVSLLCLQEDCTLITTAPHSQWVCEWRLINAAVCNLRRDEKMHELLCRTCRTLQAHLGYVVLANLECYFINEAGALNIRPPGWLVRACDKRQIFDSVNNHWLFRSKSKESSAICFYIQEIGKVKLNLLQ